MVQSKLEDFTTGGFLELIDDDQAESKEVEKVVFTSGRLYYDLVKYKAEQGLNEVAIVRLEQIFPTPQVAIDKILKKYKKADDLIWAQDEPENMGAWPFLSKKLADLNLRVVARPESASPAVGLMEKHRQGLEKLLESIFSKKEITV